MTTRTASRVLLAIVTILVAACSRGESSGRPADSEEAANGSTSSAPNAPRSSTLAAGTLIDAVITGAISSRHAQEGDVFTAQVAADVPNAGGRVVVPAGSTVHGRITEVSPAPNSRSTGTLTLAVTSVTVHGRMYDLNASIDSLETVREGRGVEAVDAARVAGGAAAGAILGRVIGGNAKGTIIGGVAGGAAGAAVSVAMKDVDIVLPAGAHLMLTLRERLTVTAE